MEDPSRTAAALAQLHAALGSIDHPLRAALGHPARLELVEQARHALSRLEALTALLVAEADRARSSVVVKGTPTTTWLRESGTSSKGEAARLVFGGHDLAERPGVREAALAGRVSVPQARAIVAIVGGLPVGLDPEQRLAAEAVMLERAETLDAAHLSQLGPEVLAAVAPWAAETAAGAQRRLEARDQRAQARRTLSFVDDGDGAYTVAGSLPHLAATPLLKALEARVESARRTQRDARLTSQLSPGQRRADALCTLAAELAREVEPSLVSDDPREGGPGIDAPGLRTPRVAGDRPRIVVTMSYDALLARAEQAGALDDGHAITAGELRRLCCDADLTPVVLGGQGELLDFGRTHRLVPAGLRKALSFRDGCCAFPHCEAPDARCEAHHIVPWWADGPTSLDNLVLLCPHHHGLVEPPRFWSGPSLDRWEVRLDSRGHPEFLPPRALDPTRTPRRQPRKPRAA